MKRFFVVVICLSVLSLLLGCGVSNRTIQDAEQRIETLKNKGVPDSSLSRAIVFVYQAKSAKERGDQSLAKLSADSMLYLIAQAEAAYEEQTTKLAPVIDSLRQVIKADEEKFSGLQKAEIDSMVAVADSFATIGWVLQTESTLRTAVERLPKLEFLQKRAEELSPRVPGKWVCAQTTKKAGHPEVNAVQYKIFEFGRDGKAKFTEKKSGQSGTHLKEDWEFVSWGTYDLYGDTIHLFVDRFASVKQDFIEKVVDDNGKQVWKKTSHPTYDSTITDGSQDRYIAFSDLRVDFKRK